MTRSHRVDLDIIRANLQTLEGRQWLRWFEHIALVAADYAGALNDDPFAYNETASVSTMVGGASRAGLVALADYTCDKAARGESATYSRGRADLFLYDPVCRRGWAFEFKQYWGQPKRDLGRSSTIFRDAKADAARLHPQEGSPYGGFIASVGHLTEQADRSAASCRLRETIEGWRPTFACRLYGPESPLNDVFFAFDPPSA